MARNKNSDLFSSLRAQGLRKRVARALSDLEGGSRGARGNAEKLARQAIKDLREAADGLEKRLNIGGSATRSRAARKAAATRKRTAAKRSTSARKAATTRARKAASRATGAARKTSARKTSGRKTSARKSTRRSTKKRS